MESCILVCSSLINIIPLNFVFKGSKCLLFSLFIINQYCMLKRFYHEKCVFIESGRLIFSLFIINSIVCLKRFYYEFYKTLLKECFLDFCFLVYLENYINIYNRLLFCLFIEFYKTSINNCF